MKNIHKIKQRGFTLIEVLAALIILAMLMPLLGDFIDRGVEQIKQRNVSNHLAAVLDAASDYAKENYSDLITSSTASGATAVTMAQLRTGAFSLTVFRILTAGGNDTESMCSSPQPEICRS